MRHTDILKLLLLAAIWGGSFIFMRVLSPVLGAIITTNSRLLIGGVVLLVYYFFAKIPIGWRDNWKQYLMIGLVNSATFFSLCLRPFTYPCFIRGGFKYHHTTFCRPICLDMVGGGDEHKKNSWFLSLLPLG